MSSWPRQRRSPRARHAIPASIFIVQALLLAQRHREEQLLDAAIVSVIENFLSSSTAVICWVTDGEMALRFGMNLPSEGCCLAPCAGCVLLITTLRKCFGSTTAAHLTRCFIPSSAEYDILSAEEETPEQLGARLHLVSGDSTWPTIL